MSSNSSLEMCDDADDTRDDAKRKGSDIRTYEHIFPLTRGTTFIQCGVRIQLSTILPVLYTSSKQLCLELTIITYVAHVPKSRVSQSSYYCKQRGDYMM